MKNTIKLSVIFAFALSVISCKDNQKPNYQYFPNMYESVAYETYSESGAFKASYGLYGKEGQLPPKGAIKRGFMPYEYPNTPEALATVKAANLKSPLDSTQVDMKKGEELFNIYCAICHGTAGDGKGKLVKQEKFLGVPNYAERQINEGSVFHVITYGLNAMGSHANQLSQEERWKVAAYVMKLKGDLSK
ncbi:c-type cytochrome [Flavobacterium croceum]|uniref:Quinol:cytochrome c oxidoreductase monoheme cytochrome subunit n=1 Tax=Flavobacterium croceum DSM 17960 TaxID=1121886 RepID=A0A2S4N5P0_9FLAO|nr:cytochrome c [Flavobacterium croceum]POS01035.1 quinol:cytochrome c oxidoreductase monoheme cytochrome subunit [Flavobacterium croceum DSM 17960]